MALTDREIIKERQVGQAQSYGLAGAPKDAVAAAHSHTRDFAKVGTENAATNVAETLMYVVNRKGLTKTVKYLTGTNVATDNTDYVVFKVSKSTAGAASVQVASYNTHGGAQGAMTANIPASFSVVSNADAVIAASDTLHYTVTKVGAGKAVAIGTISVDIEAV